MKRDEIIAQLKPYFNIEELVCNHTYDSWGEKAWQFEDTMFLWCLLVIRRDILKRPMICNTSKLHQRGLRCNLCKLVKDKKKLYLSSHLFGKAGDFTIEGMTAEEARKLIRKHADLLPCNIRMERGVSWLHFDVMQQYGVTKKVFEFE